jgi:hypothetical protein
MSTAPHFVGVYWRLFWNAQRYTRTHLFRDYPERGYQNISPEEGKSLCGESIPTYYRTSDPVGRHVCQRCWRIAARLTAGHES